MNQPAWSGSQPSPNRGSHSSGSPGSFTPVRGGCPASTMAARRSGVGSLSTNLPCSRALRVATYQPPSTGSGRGALRERVQPSTHPSTYSPTGQAPTTPSVHPSPQQQRGPPHALLALGQQPVLAQEGERLLAHPLHRLAVVRVAERCSTALARVDADGEVDLRVHQRPGHHQAGLRGQVLLHDQLGPGEALELLAHLVA